MTRTALTATEDRLSVAALTAMTVLPLLAIAARKLGMAGITGSSVFVQHLTLWVALLGAALAARSGRLLSLSTSTFLGERWRPAARVFTAAVGAAVSLCLAWASFELVRVERQGGAILAAALPVWLAEVVMPAGFGVLALRLVWDAAEHWPGRFAAGLALLLPILLGTVPGLPGSGALWPALVILLAATVAGLPVFASLGGLALLLFWNSGVPVASVAVEAYRLVASPLLPSIPLFTLAGYLLAEGGASRRLLRVFTAFFGWLPGGLAIVTAAVCAFFTITGSGVTILSLGGLMLPLLLKARYPKGFSIGLLTASGSLGLLFPPSLPVILYGVYSQTPIDRLFIGGLVPGLLMVLLAAAWGVRQGLRSGAGRAPFRWQEAWKSLWEAKWELGLPVVVLAGLFGGFATLVETAALTVLYAFVVECFFYRDLSLRRDYVRVAIECATVVGGVLVILGVAMGLTNYLVQAEAPALLFSWVRAHVHSRWVFLLLLNVFLLVVGCLMDIFAAIIVVVPLITPMGAAFGVDPVQLGIIFLVNLELGYLTPPVGMNLFLAAYRFQQPVSRVCRASLPFLLILLLGVLVITYVPILTTGPVRWAGR
jgi:C4-dicarboxylate transporter DctM subunit